MEYDIFRSSRRFIAVHAVNTKILGLVRQTDRNVYQNC